MQKCNDKFLKKFAGKIEKREEAFKQVNEYRQKAERKHKTKFHSN